MIYIRFLKYSIKRIISQEAQIQTVSEGIWCVAAFVEASEMNRVYYVNEQPNTLFHLPPRLLIYLSLFGACQAGVHFIPSWRKNGRLYSGILSRGVLSLLPAAELPNAIVLLDSLSHPAFSSTFHSNRSQGMWESGEKFRNNPFHPDSILKNPSNFTSRTLQPVVVLPIQEEKNPVQYYALLQSLSFNMSIRRLAEEV